MNRPQKIVARSFGFTLIELMVVIAIVATLLVMARPAFETFSSKSLRGSTTILTSTLRLARQHAITKRKYVWVVFPGTNGVPDYNESEVTKAMRSFAVIEGDDNDMPDRYISDWKFLPEGATLDTRDDVGGSTVMTSHGASIADFPFPHDKELKNHRIAAIQFRPNGKAYRFNGSNWTPFGVTQIGVTRADILVNTNNGQILSHSMADYAVQSNVIVRVRNPTGQVDVQYAKD